MNRNAELYGTRLRRVRQAQGLTIKDLASRTGISRQTIQAFESLRRIPSLKTAVTIADVLGVPLDMFVK